jgi:phage shock protein PspC (stress-responsive transcriptional regulator)
MPLTPQQERRLGRYLAEVEAKLDELEPVRRERLLGRLEERIRGAMNGPQASAHDEPLDAVFRSLGPPSRQAAAILDAERTPPPDTRDKRWLGLCAWAARRMGVEAWLVRLVVFALGLVLGPFLVIAYLVAWLALRKQAPELADEPVIWRRTAFTVGQVVLLVAALYAGARGILWLLHWSYFRLAGQPLILSGRWNWFDEHRGELLWWTLIIALPFAAMSGLPLAGRWPSTARKFAFAVVALFAVGLCYGVASALAGVIIQASQTINPDVVMPF